MIRVIQEQGSSEDIVAARNLIDEIFEIKDKHLSNKSLMAVCKLLMASEHPDFVRVFLNNWFDANKGEDGLPELINKAVNIMESDGFVALNDKREIQQLLLNSILRHPKLLNIFSEFSEKMNRQNLPLEQKQDFYIEASSLVKESEKIEQFDNERFVACLKLLTNPKFQELWDKSAILVSQWLFALRQSVDDNIFKPYLDFIEKDYDIVFKRNLLKSATNAKNPENRNILLQLSASELFRKEFFRLNPLQQNCLINNYEIFIALKPENQNKALKALHKLYLKEDMDQVFPLIAKDKFEVLDDIVIRAQRLLQETKYSNVAAEIKLLGKELADSLKPSLIKSTLERIQNEKGWELRGVYPRTASEAAMELLLKNEPKLAGNKFTSIPKTGDKAIEDALRKNCKALGIFLREGIFFNNCIDALRCERLNGDKYTFYQGMTPEVAALVQFYSTMRSLLMMESSGASISMLRAFDEAFFAVKTIDEFITKFNADYKQAKEEEEHKRAEMEQAGPEAARLLEQSVAAHPAVYNYLPGYVDLGISVNNSLFGGYEDPGDNTISFAAGGKSSLKLEIPNIMKFVLANLWGMSPESAEVSERVKQYESIINKIAVAKGGCLLQIMIASEAIDDLVYVAETFGKPLELDMKGEGTTTHKSSEIIPLMRNDPEAFEKRIRDNADQFESTDFSYKELYSDAVQARIFLRPDLFFSDKVQIRAYHSKISVTEGSAEADKLDNELSQLIYEDIAKTLLSSKPLGDASFVQTPTGITPLAKRSQYSESSRTRDNK